MTDASLYGLDSGVYLPGDGSSYDDSRIGLPVAADGSRRGNSLARCDNRVTAFNRGGTVSDERGDAFDATADTNRDSAPGDDAAPNVHANTAVRDNTTERPMPAMDRYAFEDTETDMDTESDVGTVRDTGPLGSLPSVLLADWRVSDG